MATDFNFDTEFDDDAGDQEQFEGFEEEETEEGEGEEKPKRNILRIVILVLFVLVLLCVVCGLIGRSGIIPIPGLGGSEPPPPPPAQDTPTPEATDVGELPQTTEQPPAQETVDGTQPEATSPAGEQPEATEESPAEQTPPPTEGPTVVISVEPVETPTTEPGETPTTEPTATPVEATNTPVPGPTPTSGPTVVITITPDICNNNIPPIADAGGPYEAMRGKGQAIVNFDGTNSTDPDGQIESYEWDFGDDSDLGNGATVTHSYTEIGSYTAILTVTDNCDATGQDTAEVTIVGPTPPATVTGTPPITTTATAVPPPTSTPDASATMGFCYRVQYGDTLSGIAWQFGVPWADLAAVNQVPMGYFVIAGQGLFIPTETLGQGPNVYQVVPGDTMYGVAYDCGLSISTLAQANGLSPTDSLSPGQTLIIPLWRP